MEVIGKLALILPEQRGESARGPWLRGGFVIDTEEQFSRKIAFSIWGEDRFNALKAIAIGTTIKVIFNIESREYQERWYTDCRCSQIETFNPAMPNGQMGGQPYNQTAPTQQQPSNPMPQPTNDAPQSNGGTIENEPEVNGDDDLPF